MRSLDQFSRGTDTDEPVDIKRAKQEDEGVDRTEDRERDRRLARSQEWRHGIRCSQNPIDYPRLAADLSGEPAGNDRNEGQRKAEESQPQQRAIICQAVLVT